MIYDLLDMLDSIDLNTLSRDELRFHKSFYNLCYGRHLMLIALRQAALN
jgi:hypothetical protein